MAAHIRKKLSLSASAIVLTQGFITALASSSLIVIPDKVPANLFSAEYVQLAKRYIQYDKYDLARECLSKPILLDSPAEIKAEALELRIQIEGLSLSPEELFKKYPNSVFSLQNLIKTLNARNAKDPQIEAILLKRLMQSPNEITALEMLSRFYYDGWNHLEASPLKRELFSKQGKLLDRIEKIDPDNAELSTQKDNRKKRGTQTFFDKSAYEEALKNPDPVTSYTFMVTDPEFSNPKRTLLETHAINSEGKTIFKTKNWRHSDDLFEYETFSKALRANNFSEGLYFDGSNFYNTSGQKAFSSWLGIAPSFEDARYFQSGYCAVKIKNNWGFIKATGQSVIAPIYKRVRSFSEGLAPVCDRNGWRYIDIKGRVVIPGPYQDAFEFSEGLAAVKIKNKFGYIDKIGKMTIAPRYDSAASFKEGLAQTIELETPILRWHSKYIKKDGSVAFDLMSIQLKLDPTGSSTPNGVTGGHGHIQPKCITQTVPCSEGLILFKVNGKCGYLNNSGKVVIQPKFDVAESFSERLAAVKVEGKYGFIDKSGEFKIIPQFASAANFSEGKAAVETSDGKRYFIDKNAKKLFQVNGFARDFHDGISLISM